MNVKTVDWTKTTPTEKLEYANRYISHSAICLNWGGKNKVAHPFQVDGFGCVRDSRGTLLFSVWEGKWKWAKLVKEKSPFKDVVIDPISKPEPMEWINKEYGKIARMLIPEIAEQDKARRKIKADRIDEMMAKLLETSKCSCSGDLKQKRKGTKVCYCVLCGSRYKAGTKKK